MDACSICNRSKEKHEDIDTRTEKRAAYVCYACAPERNLLKCTVCTLDRPPSEFKYTIKKLQRRHIRRCRSCHTCTACGTFYDDAKRMSWNSSLCCTCHKDQQQVKCTALPWSPLKHKGGEAQKKHWRSTPYHT